MGSEIINMATFIFSFVVIGIVIVIYVLTSIGLMKMANKLGEEKGWLAWIPILNCYLLGKLAYGVGFGYILMGLTLLSTKYMVTTNGEEYTHALLPTPFCDFALFGLVILSFVAFYRLYCKFSNKATIMIIFSILSLGLLIPIFIIAISGNEVRN